MNLRNLFLPILLFAVVAVWHSSCEISPKPAADKMETTVSISQLSDEKIVVPFIRKNGTLPSYYITKSEARQLGWKKTEQDFCTILPGRVIGGDRFGNRERKLPNSPGRIYFEADLSFNCKGRNAKRVVYSNDGLIFVSYDHYKTFNKK